MKEQGSGSIVDAQSFDFYLREYIQSIEDDPQHVIVVSDEGEPPLKETISIEGNFEDTPATLQSLVKEAYGEVVNKSQKKSLFALVDRRTIHFNFLSELMSGYTDCYSEIRNYGIQLFVDERIDAPRGTLLFEASTFARGDKHSNQRLATLPELLGIAQFLETFKDSARIEVKE